MPAPRPLPRSQGRRHFRPAVVPLLLAAALGLAACESPEERAAAHYDRAMEFLAEGDADRAIVEFRNVFRLDGRHAPARRAYAELLRDRGDTRGALAQYLRLVEEAPRDAAGHRDLATLALQVQDLDTAGLHAVQAYALDPADPAIRALKAALDYREGSDRPAAVAMAEAVLAEAPDQVPAAMVVIADRVDAGDLAGAIARIDAGLAASPGDEGLHLARLATLEGMGDMDGVGAELAELTARFPDNDGARAALVQWHLRQGDPAAAEALLRAAAAADTAAPEPALEVVQFLLETQGPEAARAELDRLVAAPDPEAPPGGASDPETAPPEAALPETAAAYARALAGLDFAHGRQAEAIARLRGLLAGTADAAPSDAIRALQVALATMLAETAAAPENAAESAALVAVVLAGDPSDVAALKLRARAAIAADRPEAAIQDMRAALAQAPRDPEILTIMAFAHEREGARELMGERLALAVEASGRAPEESLRYAAWLMQEGRPRLAEAVVRDALRRVPEHPELVATLGRIHLATGDWGQAEAVATLLRGIGARTGEPSLTARGDALAARVLAGQGRADETLALLDRLAAEGAADDAADGAADGAEAGAADDAAGALAAAVRARVAAGDLAGAQGRLDAILADDPASRPARLLQAGLHAVRGEATEAEALYRALLAEAAAVPVTTAATRGLVALLLEQGQGPAAAAALDEGIDAAHAAGGNAADLRLLRAGLRETAGDLPGALADYEALYAADSGSELVANNLASLLTAGMSPPPTTQTAAQTAAQTATPSATSAADLARAFAIARRLRASPVPQFQDTYGRILHLRGDPAAALAHLGPAAAALPGVALVQLHRAEAEDAVGQAATAAEAYAAALDAHAAGSPLPDAAAAAARLAALRASDG